MERKIKLIGFIAFISVIVFLILDNTDYSIESKRKLRVEKFKDMYFSYVVDTIYDDPKNHMNTTVYFKHGKWVLSPFLLNLNSIKNEIKSGDSIVKIKGNNCLVIYRDGLSKRLIFKY